MQAHDVPTHLQAEDRVLLGLTFPQIVAGMAVLGLAYGVWQRAAFLPEGHWRIAAAVTFAILGLAGIVVCPGGRALPAVVLDLLRFALTPKRYGGGIAGLPFRLLSFTLAVSVVLASVAPSAAVMAAAPPEDAQRLFIESWTVRGNRAELSVRAATSLTVQVRAQTEDGGESFRARDVLYRGERQTYSVPLRESHRAIAISWNDALGNAGLRVLDRRSFPFPIAPLETKDCTVSVTEIGWKEGQVAGRISGTCESEAEEEVEAVVLTDPDDPTKSVEQRLLLDATVQEVTGSLRLAASGPETNASRQMDFVRDGEMAFSLSVPLRSGVYDASLRADLISTHVIPLPARVDLTHREEGTWLANVPVIGRFAGFFHTVTSTLSAVWDPVSTHLSAFLGPVTRTLWTTLQAAWDPVTETVGGWVSATVGTWLSTTVGSWLSTTVGSWLSATVGSWLSATVGSWLSATVGSWLSTTVGAWLSTTVGSWLSTTVGTWLTGTVGTWLSATVGTWLTATVGTVVTAVVGGFFTTVSHWVNIILGWLNLNVWVPEEEASGYASDTASEYASDTATGYASGSATGYATGYASGSATGYASGSATGYASDTATGYASGSATGYASGSATGYASGSASGYASGSATGYASGSATGYASGSASGSATGYASDTATGYAEDTATGYASDTATGYASDTATGYASGSATGYASGYATGYASTQVTLPGRTEQSTVSETVEIPGRTAEREVSEDVWIEGIEVEQEVEVEVVIPAYTSAEVTETEPLVREYRETASASFAFLSDAPYEPLPDPPEGSEVPSQAAQYVLLLEEEDDEDGDGDGGDDDTNPYREALDRFSGFDLHPDEALMLYSALYVAWLDSLTISLEAREVMEERAGGVVSETEYSMEDIPGEAVDTQELFKELVGEELR